jgi:TPR repeat protein
MNRTAKAAAAALVLALSFAGSVAAGPAEDVAAAVAAHKRGDYATALRLIRPLADQGDADAQNILGLMYAQGRGVPQDYVVAR